MASLTPNFHNQFFDAGLVAAGYLLHTRVAGTTTPKAAYTNQAGTIPHTNPIVLTSQGQIPGQLWLGPGEYRFRLETPGGALVDEWDDIDSLSPDTESLADTSDATKGASMVGLNATLNYAVATIGARLREKCSVTDFPWLADATGATDSTAAINGALSAGFDVQVPEGTFRIDGTVTVDNAKSLTLARKAKLIRKSASSVSTAPVVYVIDSRSELTGGIIQSENASPNGVVCLGHMSSADNRNAWNWRFSQCDVFAMNNPGDIGVNVPSGQVTYINRANYFGFIDSVSIYGGDIGLLLAEQANAHNISNLQFWYQTTACLKLRGAYGNNIVNFFCHQGQASGVTGVHIANKTASLQESNWNAITNFTVETGGAADHSVIIDSNCQVNRVICGSNVSGGAINNNANNFLMVNSSMLAPIVAQGMTITADASAYAISARGRTSDNNAYIALLSNDGATRYGYIHGLPTEFRIVSDAARPLTFYVDGGEAFRAIPTTRDLAAGADNARKCGTAALRWSEVFAGNATINTSDERSKEQIQPIDAAVLRAWAKVNYCQFKMKDAVAKKGDGARWHMGVVAQRVKEAFESEGLDAFTYGLLCYDEWDELAEPVTDDAGNQAGERVVYAAGNRYGIRYEEALALECAYLRSKLETL